MRLIVVGDKSRVKELSLGCDDALQSLTQSVKDGIVMIITYVTENQSKNVMKPERESLTSKTKIEMQHHKISL
jgi:SAM-dependent MidA family methyltransferase